MKYFHSLSNFKPMKTITMYKVSGWVNKVHYGLCERWAWSTTNPGARNIHHFVWNNSYLAPRLREIKHKKWIIHPWVLIRFLLFYNRYPLTQVGILRIRKWAILFYFWNSYSMIFIFISGWFSVFLPPSKPRHQATTQSTPGFNHQEPSRRSPVCFEE